MWAFVPPEQKVKLGLDLKGGHAHYVGTLVAHPPVGLAAVLRGGDDLRALRRRHLRSHRDAPRRIVHGVLFMTPQFSLGVESGDVFRLIVFAVVALLTSSIAAERNRTHAAQQKLVEDLQSANARIRTLSDMLPICPDCRRVRVGEGNDKWQSVEKYLAETPDLHISHALCPDCSARHFPEFQPHG